MIYVLLLAATKFISCDRVKAGSVGLFSGNIRQQQHEEREVARENDSVFKSFGGVILNLVAFAYSFRLL